MDEDEEARAKRREEAEAEAARLSALERAKLSESELRAAMDEKLGAVASGSGRVSPGVRGPQGSVVGVRSYDSAKEASLYSV